MNKNIDSMPGVKKIGCAWNSQIGKVVGRFMVLPIEEKIQVDTRDYYLCEFIKLVFIRVIEGNKYIDILQLPEKLKEEVNFLMGSKKIISGDVLRNGNLVYTECPSNDKKQDDNIYKSRILVISAPRIFHDAFFIAS